MKQKFIVMNPEDNCATSLDDIPENSSNEIEEEIIQNNQEIPLGHKIALSDIKKGDLIKKYGQIIGRAIIDISKGDWIHTHNITSAYMEMGKNE